jgi:hypothetical protein
MRPTLQFHIGKIADGVATGLVRIAENRNVDEMSRCVIWPDLAIDLSQVGDGMSPMSQAAHSPSFLRVITTAGIPNKLGV